MPTSPWSLSLSIAAFAAACVTTLIAQGTATIVVDSNQLLGPVNRLIFGQNINAADNARIFSSNVTDLNLIQRGGGFWDPANAAPVQEVVNESKSAGMSMLRYPGGCLAHNFDWRKTVGPQAKANGWLFGLNEYLALCNALGAVPLITVSDYVLPADQMPENAATLVEYLNSPADAAHPWALRRQQWGHPEPYHVTWFELGNESIHGNHRVLPHRQYNAEEYAAYVNATAAAMRKVDPTVKLGIVMVPSAGTDVHSDWNRTVVHRAGKSADFIAIHMYAPQGAAKGIANDLLLQSMMATPAQVEQHLVEYHEMIRQQIGHDLPLAITEFNGAIDQYSKRLSYANALECSDLLRVFLEPKTNVAFANYWIFLDSQFGMLLPAAPSAKSQSVAEGPALPLYRLWAQHFGSRLVKVDVDSPLSEFPGAGSALAATGTIAEASRKIKTVDLSQYSSAVDTLWPRLADVQIQRQNSDFTIRIQGLNRSIYPVLARIPRASGSPEDQVEFSVSFDAKLTLDAGSNTAPMGIGLIDSRGWNQTHSGIGIDDITTDWKHFDATYRADILTASVDLSARLMADGKSVFGKLQVRNLVLTESFAGHDAAYPILTSSASTSSDGREVYIMVLNKSASEAIAGNLHLVGFTATRGRYWQVNGPSIDATSGVSETAQGTHIPVSHSSALSFVFPAHSMTAIEFNSDR